MAQIKPFAALRYDTGQAGPLEDLVAPPYDVIGPAEREEYLARSPYNVVHLTLPDSEEEAGRSLRAWRENGILATEEPAFWALSQDYVGPDGVARTRTGLVVSLGIEPYETGTVLPHERTHRGPKEGRLRLLRATQTQLEPIFLLYEGQAPFAVPGPLAGARGRRREALAAAKTTWHRRRVRRPAAPDRGRPPSLRDGAGLPRGGGNPGQRDNDGRARQPRGSRPDDLSDPPRLPRAAVRGLLGGRASATIRSPRSRSSTALERGRAAVVVYDGSTELAVDGAGELDVQLVDRLGQEGLSYTADWREAVRAVDEGEAAVAVLMRPTRIEDVFEVAARGETMPQKSTYFYPKLVSGLLFHPLDA